MHSRQICAALDQKDESCQVESEQILPTDGRITRKGMMKVGYRVADILFKLGRVSAFRLNDMPGMFARVLVRRTEWKLPPSLPPSLN